MKGVYRFYWDCGRNGDLTGIFVSDAETIAKSIGKSVYFGEVLGKHSEVYGTIDEGDIELLTDDATAVDVIERFKLESGFNPLDYIRDDEDEE